MKFHKILSEFSDFIFSGGDKNKQEDRSNKQCNEIRSGDSARDRCECETENEEKLFEKAEIKE